MTEATEKPWIGIQERLLSILDGVLAKKVDLAQEENAYDISYLRTKLVTLSTMQESLSDTSLQLTQQHLNVLQASTNAAALRRLREATLKESQQYVDLPRGEKTAWLEKEMAVYRDKDEAWRQTLVVSDEVRNAVAERTQTMKRLDSALRLHQKLLEDGVRGIGAFGSPLIPPGKDLDQGKRVGVRPGDNDEIQLT